MNQLFRSLSVILLAVGLYSGPSRAEGEVAPAIELRDINGQDVKLSQFKGQVVLLNFWATWCQPCKVEMTHLQKFQDEFGKKGFTVLSVSIDDARAASQVKPFIKSNGYTFPVLLDKETTVVTQFNSDKTLPYTAIIDKEGKIRHVHRGYNPGDEVKLREEILAMIGG